MLIRNGKVRIQDNKSNCSFVKYKEVETELKLVVNSQKIDVASVTTRSDARTIVAAVNTLIASDESVKCESIRFIFDY